MYFVDYQLRINYEAVVYEEGRRISTTTPLGYHLLPLIEWRVGMQRKLE